MGAFQAAPQTDLQRKLVLALEDNRFQWRTVDGLADELKVSRETVAETLADLQGIVVRSSVPDDLGRSLYTTRRHYQATHTVGQRLLAALADRVA